MDKLRIPLQGKVDTLGNEYYVSTCEAPIMIDLSKTVIHVFPDEDPDNPDHFWADLVVRKYDGKHGGRGPRRSLRRRRQKGENGEENNGTEDKKGSDSE